MKKIIFAIVMLLVVGFVSAQDLSQCSDSDNGLNYNTRGTVTGHNEDDPTDAITTATDSCSDNLLHEWICKDSINFDDESYVCPYGCSNGACIAAPAATCTDSDNGVNAFVKGTLTFVSGDFRGVKEDVCMIADEYSADGTPSASHSADSCSGDNCYVLDYYCKRDSAGNLVDADANQKVKCFYGCSNGACLSEESTCLWPNGCCNIDADCPSSAPHCITSAVNEGPSYGTGVCDPGYTGHYCDKSEGSKDCMAGYTCNVNCNNYKELSWCSSMLGAGQLAVGNTECESCKIDSNKRCIGGITPSTTTQLVPKCTETDGGDNPNIYGSITYGDKRYNDYCSDSRSVKEYFCRDDGTPGDLSHSCDSGCSNGACVNTDYACKDSDGGQDFYTFGVTSNSASSYKDYCYSSNSVFEYYCANGYDIGNMIKQCPNGERCSDGACIREKPACETTVDSNGCTITKCPDGTVTTNCYGLYAKLNERFKLGQGQSVKITDYNYMKLTFNGIICAATSCGAGSGCVGDNCPVASCVGGGESSCFASMIAEMPSVCKTGSDVDCATTGTEISIREGESKEVFGAKLSFVSRSGDVGTFLVQKTTDNIGAVDVSIRPGDVTINYGETATYYVTVTDKRKMPVCPAGSYCEMPPPITYYISVQNLPFSKEYQQEVSLFAGRSQEIKLIVTPYQMTTESVVETKDIAGQAVASPQLLTKIAAESTSTQIVARDYPETPIPIDKYKTYRFSVTAYQRDNKINQDTAYAVLMINPITPPLPPDFPGEEVTIKLYKGWNLIRLPGNLMRFEVVEGSTSKLIGFVYYKGKFVTLNEAENLLGTQFREYLSKHAFWVYAPENVALKVKVDTQISLNGLGLESGWNLVPITEDMVGGYLYDIKGSCTFEKIYLWNPISQSWQKIDERYIFHESDMNYGMVIKTGEGCILGGGEVEIAPPSMPE